MKRGYLNCFKLRSQFSLISDRISPNRYFLCSESAIASGWLQVYTVSAIPAEIPAELDQGEREAIALALEISEQRILLDEREARQVAQRFGLQVIGTLGILLLAKDNQVILQVQPLLDGMMSMAQYWVATTLYQQVLRKAGELTE